jgi:mono/diheme cytochrome c family protein
VKNFFVGSLSAIVFVTVGLTAYLGLGFMDVAADQKLSSRETAFMAASLRASVGRRAPLTENPLPNSDDTLVAGGKLYLNNCVGCHGEPGQPASDFGASFYPPASQFPLVGTQLSEPQIFWVARNGIRLTGMYPQHPSYTDSQLWSLAAFISHASNLPPTVTKIIQPPASN